MNNVAEASTLLQGLVIASSLGCTCIHVEGDSMISIHACINKKIVNKNLAYIYKKIWRLIDSFDSCTISHIYQEINSDANHLSNLGCDDILIVDHDMDKVIYIHPMLEAIIFEEQTRT